MRLPLLILLTAMGAITAMPGCRAVTEKKAVPFDEKVRQAEAEASRRGRQETIPKVTFHPLPAAFRASPPVQKGPGWLMAGRGLMEDGTLYPADVPSRSLIRIQTKRSSSSPARRKGGPRYFISAPGLIQVASIEHYSAYNTRHVDRRSHVDGWRRLIRTPGPLDAAGRQWLATSRKAEIPWFNASPAFYGRPEVKSFPWGKAVCFLTKYIQGRTGGYVDNVSLVLVVQGFTHDGRYAVNARLAIRHPLLPESTWDAEGSPPNRASRGKTLIPLEGDKAAVEAWLESRPASSFRPSLQQFDDLLASMVISPPPPGKDKKS